jgi:hypothetical protein
MKTSEIINELIDTVICGNKVSGNETYEKMLKKVSFSEIKSYLKEFSYEIKGIYWAPKSRFNVGPKDEIGNWVTKVDFFDKYIKASF